ncbi:MAG: hypothetical protein CVV49_20285 [Spirochaetae bacterium HGW-Spirochaetae-5]|nr:MAG: hypothetical protein CVV49_20285 [Spirochaetae bacterium HGW-Spirochaetae-5]
MNDYLVNDVKHYTGRVEDVDLALWRGAYLIEGFYLNKKNTNIKIPFIEIDTIDISISWRALFRGMFLADLILSEPKVNFVDSKRNKNKQSVEDENWKDILNEVVPFNLETLVITKGEIHFINNEIKVPIDIYFKHIELKAQNIHNSKKQNSALFSRYELSATPQNHGELYSKGTFNILVEPPDFDINLKIEQMKLTQLNAFLKAYGPIDLTSGEFDFYMEMASRNGKIAGYLKPVFKNMDVRAGREEKDNSFKETSFEVITALVNVILKNRNTKLLAAEFPIEGDLKNPEVNIWKGIRSLIANHFGKPAFKLKIDNTINLKSVKEEYGIKTERP